MSKKETKIYSDSKTVISSGSVFQFEDESVNFQIESLKVRLCFISNKRDAKAEIKYSDVEECLIISLYNYNNNLGIGFSEPVKVGHGSNKDVYFICRVYTLGEEDKNHLIHYTFYMEK